MNRRSILKALLVAPLVALFRRPERNYVENPGFGPWVEGSHATSLFEAGNAELRALDMDPISTTTSPYDT